MNNKKIISIVTFTVAASLFVWASSNRRIQPPTQAQPTLSGLLNMVDSQIHFFNSAWAEGSPECDAASSAAVAACQTANTAYTHGALNYFNNMLCMMNNQTAAIAENALCHFSKSMGMSPDKAALPQSITKTFGTQTVVLSVVAPTESFAAGLGYDAKATVTVDGVNFMVLYWGGTGASSAGFLIQGPNGMGGGSTKRPMYIQWSRKDPSNQFVKILSANFTTSYLGTINDGTGDTAMYGKATFNTTTRAVTTQMLRMEGQRGGGTASTKACFRMLAEGTKDGTMTVIKTQNSMSATGHAATLATTVITDETDAFQGTDATSTTNGTGNVATVTTGVTTPFDKTCSYLNSAGGGGQPFASDTVDFAIAPATLFP